MSASTIQASQLLIQNENDRRERLARQGSHGKNDSTDDKSLTGAFNSSARRWHPSPEHKSRLEEFKREEREHFERVEREKPARKQLLEEVSKKPGECDLEKAKQLLEQVTVNEDRPGDKFGTALFNKAAASGHLEIVKAVIAEGATPNSYDIRDAVSLAAYRGQDDIKEFLVETYPEVIAEYLPSMAMPRQRPPAP